MEGTLSDGAYTIEVSLSGGSGRATIASPAELTVSDGVVAADIVWSSPNYDYMEVGGVDYFPIATEGNSVFRVVVPALDEDIPVLAETVAMSEPHRIEYTIRFDSATLRSREVAEIWVGTRAAAIAVVVIIAIGAVGAIKKGKKKAK
ncbi:MAG: hypothetical protein NC084_01105 [Bacteroides sp.]|nr:hypothetical protein [Eubacterium sp.]MCM1417850.1 hypothetical protein [Roseburia sp.]MCM1461289.1 hypothetical protein [Bacteroides sp.]